MIALQRQHGCRFTPSDRACIVFVSLLFGSLLAGAPAPVHSGPPVFPAHWKVEPSEPILPVFDAAIAVSRGRIALLGGFTEKLETTQVIQIRNESGGWLPIGSQMIEPRARHTATPLGDGRVLIVGGVQGTIGGEITALASCEVLDPFGAGSIAVDPLDEPLVGHTAHKLPNDLVAVIGGAAMRLFDPASLKWIARIDLQKRRANHASLIIEGADILIIGGDDARTIERVDLPDAFGGAVDGASIDRGSLDAITSSVIGNLQPESGVSRCAAVELSDGRIWIVGGLMAKDETSVCDTWFFDVPTGQLLAGPALPFEGGMADGEAFRADNYAVVVGGETHQLGNRRPANVTAMYEAATNRLWLLPEVPAVPAAPGAPAVAASRRHWYLDDAGHIGAEGGYRFVSPEEAERTGESPGVHLLEERITLIIGQIPTLRD